MRKLRIEGRFINYSIINVHRPHEGRPYDENEAFYAQLEQTYDGCPVTVSNNKPGEVQSRLDKIETKFEEFEEVQEEIAELDVEGAYEEDCTKAYEEFEKLYYRLRAALLAKLPTETHGDLNNMLARNGQPIGAHTGVRLPQISLPEFDGDYKQWLSFKSTYVSLIHDSGELSDVQKFHYLKSALKGEAAKLIESLTLTNDNYLIAWSTITKRYSNEYLLKKRHLQALMEYPKVEKESSAAIHARSG
ncbi:uncharacterized protein LOC134202208 [Armigeres subalbatus]|uniref:uncharacterized protein LOC134202208 n=1 Tax=Armigeres subalbatus TaxID=124917 RepID=UPI002ED306D1